MTSEDILPRFIEPAHQKKPAPQACLQNPIRHGSGVAHNRHRAINHRDQPLALKGFDLVPQSVELAHRSMISAAILPQTTDTRRPLKQKTHPLVMRPKAHSWIMNERVGVGSENYIHDSENVNFILINQSVCLSVRASPSSLRWHLKSTMSSIQSPTESE